MSKQTLFLNLFAGGLLLCIVIALEFLSDLDMFLQRQWYDETKSLWCIPKSFHYEWKWLVYSGAKKLISAIAISAAVLFAYGIWKPARRALCKPALLLVLSCIILPSILGGTREFTNVYCPEQLTDFGGDRVYQRILEPRNPANDGKTPGHCFPAGHASGGFALMSLFFCIPSKKWRWLGLAGGLAAGWSMGLYQVLRGEHFLSHTFATMFGGWMLICLIAWTLDRFWPAISHLLDKAYRYLRRNSRGLDG